MTPRDLGEELACAGVNDVLMDVGSRAQYSSDASLYRLVPSAVVRPRDSDEAEATIGMAGRRGVPIVARRAGTSVAGNAIGRGVVLDSSTMSRCTIGGMIGNNACGSRSLGYGRTSDNVHGLRLLLADGSTAAVGNLRDPLAPDDPRLERLRTVVRAELATIRAELGRFERQVSGYDLEHLLPEALDRDGAPGERAGANTGRGTASC